MSEENKISKCLTCGGDMVKDEQPAPTGVNLPLRFKEGMVHLSLSVLAYGDDPKDKPVPVVCYPCQMRAAKAAAGSLWQI